MRITSVNSLNYIKNFAMPQKTNIINKTTDNISSLPYVNYISFGQIQKVTAEKKINPVLKAILDEYTKLPQVEAVAIGGSSIGNNADKSSDIDIYVFTKDDIDIEKREKIAEKFSKIMDIGQDYFGPDDEYYADSLGKAIDVVYFSTKQMEDNVRDVWDNHNASNGYTTCFLYTLKNSKTFSDKNGWLQNIKSRINTPYPKELKENIISRNMLLLKDKPFASYSQQIKKAMDRKDYNSLNHRIAAFMASYFDIIFAMNEVLHPGEKRLVQFAKSNCRVLPNDFEENIEALMTRPTSNTTIILDDMVKELKKSLNYV